MERGRIEKLVNKLKILNGLPPYDKFSNISYGDPYFSKSINSEYTKEEIKYAKRLMGLGGN